MTAALRRPRSAEERAWWLAQARATSASRVHPFRASVPSLGDTGTPLPVEGIGLLAPPAAVHNPLGMTAHFHLTREERRACEAEHATIRARWDALNRPQE